MFFQTRKKSAFCLKLTYTLFEKMYEVQTNTIFDFWVFSKIWKDNSSKIGFSMTSYPDVSLLHVSTAFREIKYKKQFFQTRKKSAFCLKLTYTLFEKMYDVQKNTIFDFSLFQKFEKIIHRKSDSPWKMTPGVLIFSSLRHFGEG